MLDAVREPVERPPDVLREQLERARHLAREPADAQLIVEEEHADVDAVQQVVEVVGELGELRDLALVLGVDRVELLVDRVQLLVGALQLLVRGDELLVRGLELLVRRLELLDGRLQVLPGEAQLRLQRVHVLPGLRRSRLVHRRRSAVVRGLASAAAPASVALDLDAHEEVRAAVRALPSGSTSSVHRLARPPASHATGPSAHRRLTLRHVLQRRRDRRLAGSRPPGRAG